MPVRDGAIGVRAIGKLFPQCGHATRGLVGACVAAALTKKCDWGGLELPEVLSLSSAHRPDLAVLTVDVRFNYETCLINFPRQGHGNESLHLSRHLDLLKVLASYGKNVAISIPIPMPQHIADDV